MILAGALLAAVLVAPSFASAEGVCPNEQLRTENHSTALPDCRAYEMVSPPFENGQPPTTPFSGVALDGSSVFFTSIGITGCPTAAAARKAGTAKHGPTNGHSRAS